jgi:cytochrome c553
MRCSPPEMGRRAGRYLATMLALAVAAGPAFARQPVTIESCLPCHGADGIARSADVPHLAGQNEAYLFKQMLAFKAGTRRHAEMRFMAREMSTQEMEAIAAYYAGLPGR